MMDKQIPSKVIMEKSGHLSKDGLLPYEQTTSIQQQLSSKAVTLLKGSQESECKDLIKKESQTRGDVGEENQTILKGMNFHTWKDVQLTSAFTPNDSQCYMYLATTLSFCIITVKKVNLMAKHGCIYRLYFQWVTSSIIVYVCTL